MALSFDTNNPSALLANFKKKIDQKHVVTWSYDADGDFTHAVDQWRNMAWFRPTVVAGRLIMSIMPPRGQTITKPVYGVYHGRFAESMLTHCDDMFSNVTASALPAEKDIVKAAA